MRDSRLASIGEIKLAVIFLWMKTVRPSLIQKSPQVLQVTRLPVQECAISWMAVETCDLSPVIMVGDTNVNNGFSMPPKGNAGGKTNKL